MSTFPLGAFLPHQPSGLCYILVGGEIRTGPTVATVASLPDEQQDDFARILLQLAGHEQSVYVLTRRKKPTLTLRSRWKIAAISRPTRK